MIYYLAKGGQALGLVVIGLDFIRHFPALMNPKIFAAGGLIFLAGWLVERFMLRK